MYTRISIYIYAFFSLAITDAFRLAITGDCECCVNYISSYVMSRRFCYNK